MENFNYYQKNLSLHLLRNFFLEHGKQHTYRKKDFFIRQHEVSRSAGWVESGSFEYSFTDEEGLEHIVGYAFENEFVCDYSSFIKSQQSKVSIQAISDCVVYEIALNELVTYWEVGYAFENEFVCDYSSFIKSQQSKVSIQAISDCVVYEIALNELVTYWEVNLDNLKEGKKAAENLYELAYDRFLDSYCSPMIRYKKLMSRCPKLKEKVPLRSIASFLGVTPETISHIRKKIRLDGKS